MDDHPEGSAGGRALRSLRQERGLTQEQLADLAGISAPTLIGIEKGKIDPPKRQTLEDVLGALEEAKPLTAAERQRVLEPFRYSDVPSLPTPEDVKAAVRTFASEFDRMPFPAYLVDYPQRIHDWNDVALRFLGTDRSRAPRDLTVFDLAFNPRVQAGFEVEGAEEFLMKLVKMMKDEFTPFLGLPWCATCVEAARRAYPLFGQLWDRVPAEAVKPVAVRKMGPLVLRDRSGNRWTFELIGTDLVTDRRFRVVQYQPLDKETAAFCHDLHEGSRHDLHEGSRGVLP